MIGGSGAKRQNTFTIIIIFLIILLVLVLAFFWRGEIPEIIGTWEVTEQRFYMAGEWIEIQADVGHAIIEIRPEGRIISTLDGVVLENVLWDISGDGRLMTTDDDGGQAFVEFTVAGDTLELRRPELVLVLRRVQ